jgi:hypothetical protein
LAEFITVLLSQCFLSSIVQKTMPMEQYCENKKAPFGAGVSLGALDGTFWIGRVMAYSREVMGFLLESLDDWILDLPAFRVRRRSG